MATNRPTFPGLYRPHFELDPSILVPIQPNGQYLEDAGDIYVFTLYWTFIFYTPLFVIAGACAALFLALKPLRSTHSLPATSAVSTIGKLSHAPPRRAILYGAVIFLVYIVVGTGLAVIGSTVIGFLIAGVYKAGRFQVSTWVPFVWALLQALVALTSMCSLIIELI